MPTLLTTRDALIAVINAGSFGFTAIAAYVPQDDDKPTDWTCTVEPFAAADTAAASRALKSTVEQQFSVVLRNGVQR